MPLSPEMQEKLRDISKPAPKPKPAPSFARRASSGVGRFFEGFAKRRARTIKFARSIKQSPYAVSKVKKKSLFGPKRGIGRPAGPSGKYSIPGLGPVGVYEYRKWLNTQLQIQRLQARQQAMQNMQKVSAFNQRQAAAQMPVEQKTFPDTKGVVPMRSIHQEIDDFANEVP